MRAHAHKWSQIFIKSYPESTNEQFQTKVDIASFTTAASEFVRIYNDLPRTAHGVPMVVHQVYIDTNVPNQYAQYARTIKRAMPAWIHVLWSDDDVEKYLLPRIHNEERSLFRRYPQAINRADMTRYLLMELFGGMYLDLDAELLRDAEPELTQGGGVWTVEGFAAIPNTPSPPKLETHMWISQPRHPFWSVVRQLLLERGEGIQYKFDFDVLQITGPRMIYDAFLRYKAQDTNAQFGGFEVLDSTRYNFGRTRPDGVVHHHFAHEWLWVIKRVNIQRVISCLVLFFAMVTILHFAWQCSRYSKKSSE